VALFEAAVFDQFLIFDNWGILKNENPPKAGLGGAMKQLFQNFSVNALFSLPPSDLLALVVMCLLALCVIGPVIFWLCLQIKSGAEVLADRNLWLFLAGAAVLGFILEALNIY
jgi:hypothetical protein